MHLRHILLLLLVTTVWGVNFVVIKIGLRGVPPLTFSALRFLVAAVPAIFLVRRPEASRSQLAVYGLVMFAGQFAFLFSAMEAGLSAGLASLVLQTQAFFTIGLALLFLRERPGLFQLLGAVVAAAGVGIVGLHIGGEVTWPGLLLVMASALCFGGGNILVKRFGKTDMFAVVVWGSLFAFFPLALCALAIEGPDAVMQSVTDIGAASLLALAYIVYLSTFFAFTSWNRMLALYPAASVAPFTLLVPVFGMASASLLLNEAYPAWKFLATLLIIAGLALNQFGGKLLQLMRRRLTA